VLTETEKKTDGVSLILDEVAVTVYIYLYCDWFYIRPQFWFWDFAWFFLDESFSFVPSCGA
jgi:hypothetical protein